MGFYVLKPPYDYEARFKGAPVTLHNFTGVGATRK